MNTHDVDRVISVLEFIVADAGKDYVYVNPRGETAGDGIQCYYVHGFEPGCIVGRALHRLGVPLDELSAREGMNASAVIRDLDIEGVIQLTDPAARVLGGVQVCQDAGIPWGEALEFELKYHAAKSKSI